MDPEKPSEINYFSRSHSSRSLGHYLLLMTISDGFTPVFMEIIDQETLIGVLYLNMRISKYTDYNQVALTCLFISQAEGNHQQSLQIVAYRAKKKQIKSPGSLRLYVEVNT